MHICLSAGAYPTPEQPFASFIASLAQEFTKNGHNVTVIAPQSITKKLFRRNYKLLPYEMILPFEKSYIRVLRPKTITFGDRGILGKLTMIMNRWSVCNSFRKIKSNVDLIYAHFWTSGYNIAPCAVKYNLPLFVATGEDEIFLTKLISKRCVDQLRELVRGVICVSSKNMKESISLNLTTKEKCIVLPNAVDLKKFHLVGKSEARKRLGFNQEDFIVAFVGRFNSRKGAKRLSDAIEILNDSSIKSIFIGSTMSDESIAEEPNCPGIIFKGKVNHDDIALYLCSADIFVLPTIAEGCSNSIVEALACGLPVISSNLDFNLDLLNSSNAILVNPKNISEIAESIKFLKENTSICKEMSESALETGRKLDYSIRVKNILNFINLRINESSCIFD